MKQQRVETKPLFVTVAPYAGAWIETIDQLPTTESCGQVAPYAGAWIETIDQLPTTESCGVAPYAGAWIETQVVNAKYVHICKSLPTRERGLKQTCNILLQSR